MANIQVDARGEACPIPVVKTKQAIQALQGSVTVYRMVFHALKERHCPGRNLIRIHMGMYINYHKLSSLLFFFHSTSFYSVLQEENLPFFNIFPIQNRKCILTFRKEYVFHK